MTNITNTGFGALNSDLINVNNFINGKFNTIYTSGSIPFISSIGRFTEDNSNLFFDGTNKRFGLGTNTPLTQFHKHQINSFSPVMIGSNAANVSVFLENIADDSVVQPSGSVMIGTVSSLDVDVVNPNVWIASVSNLETKLGSSTSTSSEFISGVFNGLHQGTGTVGGIQSLIARTINTSTGTINNAQGVTCQVVNQDVGLINSAQCFVCQTGNISTGTINTLQSLEIEMSNQGTISNAQAIDIQMSNNNTITNSQAVNIQMSNDSAMINSQAINIQTSNNNTISNVEAINIQMNNNNTISDVGGVAINLQTSGTISNANMITVNSPDTSGGSISNTIGLNINQLNNSNNGSSPNGGFNSTGIAVSVPVQGDNTSGTNNNTALSIYGNGASPGVGGIVNNYSINNTSTAPSYFAGRMGLNNSSPQYALDVAGDVASTSIGNGFRIAEGPNGKQGSVVLAAGVATVFTTNVTSNSRIFLSSFGSALTNPGFVYVSSISDGVSFGITSLNPADTSTIFYLINEIA